MFRGANLSMRWMVVSLAAYALVLHALAMSSMAFATGDDSICRGTIAIADGGPWTPAPDKPHSPPCALCGLGHGMVALPSAAIVPAPVNIIETVARQMPGERLPAIRLAERPAQPRAPPAFS
jgi:hypothetical protein